jgi:hypothetical protein
VATDILKKLGITGVLKKLREFYGARKFIAVSTTAEDFSLHSTCLM